MKKLGRPCQKGQVKKVRSVRVIDRDFRKIKRKYKSLQNFIDKCIEKLNKGGKNEK